MVLKMLGFHMILVLVQVEPTNGLKLGLESLKLELVENPFSGIRPWDFIFDLEPRVECLGSTFASG